MHDAGNFSFQGMQFRPRCGHFYQDSFQRKLSVKIKCTIFAFYFNHSFFRYLCGKNSDDNFTDRLSALVERVKMNAQWRHRYMTIEQEIKLQARYLAQDMAKNMANDMAKDMAKDMAQGIAKNMANDIVQSKVDESKLETAKNLLKINISPEQIAMATGLSLEQVKNLETGEI